ERAPDRLQRDAELCGAIAIDGHPDLRLALLVARIDVLQAGIRARQLENVIRPPRDGLVVRPADIRLHLRPEAASSKAARLAGKCAHARHLAHFCEQRLRDLARRALAFAPVLQDHDRASGVDIAGARTAAVGGYSDHHTFDVVAAVHLPHDDLLHLPRLTIHVVEARSLWTFDREKDATDVRGGRELRGHRHEREGAERDEHADGADHEPRAPYERAQAPVVQLRGAFEESIH